MSQEAINLDPQTETQEPAPTPEEQNGVDKTYHITIGGFGSYVENMAARFAQEKVEEQIRLNHLPHSNHQGLSALAHEFAYSINPAHWKEMGQKFFYEHTQSYQEQKEALSHLGVLARINIGLRTKLDDLTLNSVENIRKHLDIASSAQELKQSSASVAERISLGVLRSSETQNFGVSQDLKEHVIEKILRPLIADGIINEQASRAEVQTSLMLFFDDHKDDPQIKGLFTTHKCEAVMAFYATNLLETAKELITDIALDNAAQ